MNPRLGPTALAFSRRAVREGQAMRSLMWPYALGSVALLQTSAAAQEQPLLVQQEIQAEVTRMLHAVDALDWAGVRDAFTDHVRTDYTSLFGGRPETLAVDSLLARWRGLLPGFDATQHLIGPVVVVQRHEGDATAETQVRAYHHIAGAEAGAVWMVAGRYVFTMQERDGGWKVAGITFQLAYQTGNLELPAFAQRRAAAGEGRARR